MKSMTKTKSSPRYQPRWVILEEIKKEETRKEKYGILAYFPKNVTRDKK